MPRRAALATQADIERAIRAAKNAGACAVEVPTKAGPPIVIRLDDLKTVATEELDAL